MSQQCYYDKRTVFTHCHQSDLTPCFHTITDRHICKCKFSCHSHPTSLWNSTFDLMTVFSVTPSPLLTVSYMVKVVGRESGLSCLSLTSSVSYTHMHIAGSIQLFVITHKEWESLVTKIICSKQNDVINHDCGTSA